jgi:hypothetical protein
MPAPLIDTVASVLNEYHPLVFCFPCLAALTDAPEKAVREAAQSLLLTEQWRVSPRRCARCGTEGELLERRSVP